MSPEQYLEWRHALTQIWGKRDIIIALLPAEDQWYLHDYFQFHYHKNPADALSWYYTLQTCDPTVETDALRAFRKLQQILYNLYQQKDQLELPLYPRKGKGSEDRVRVYGLVNPEPDINKMVKALIELARQQIREQDKNKLQP